MEEPFLRTTLSFYRYVTIRDPVAFRDELFRKFEQVGIFGRIYLAAEGINAQISVPQPQWDHFTELISSFPELNKMPLKIAVEDNGKSFYKLIIKVRGKIVADGLPDDAFDKNNVGRHLSAAEFNDAMMEGAVVVDLRNHYESEVGRFKGAICPDADTFKQELPMTLELLKDKKEEKILLYCTGGIRCEKASAFLKHHGFKDVNQLYGGIIDYARQVQAQNLENFFIGKNFVFDDRLGERITEDIISFCHQCGQPADSHTNCNNRDCHMLFIQCTMCADKFAGCCSEKCREINNLPIEAQQRLRKGKIKVDSHAVYRKGRLRPGAKDFVSNQAL